MPPLEAIVAAFVGAASYFEERRELARGARPSSRRTPSSAPARLAADAGITIFRVGFESWVGGTGEPTLGQILRETADELAAVTGALAANR